MDLPRPRIGVFICGCGEEVAGRLDVEGLLRTTLALRSVVWSGRMSYWCLPAGIERMRSTISKENLDRLVIAGCTPRTHGRHFIRALDDLVNPTLIQVINLRDLCARPHRDDSIGAMAKGRDLIAMAVSQVAVRQRDHPRAVSILPHAVVIGGGVAGMTAALSLGNAAIPVTLIERQRSLGGLAQARSIDSEITGLIAERIAALDSCENVRILTNTQIDGVDGTVGSYRLALSNGDVVRAGVIIVATGAQSNLRSFDSSARDYCFVLCDMSPERVETCAHICCPGALRQAVEIKRRSADAAVTILFRELYTAGGTYDELVWEAQRLGVAFVRYPAGRVPQLKDGKIETQDQLTGREVHLACDSLIPAARMMSQDDAPGLAAMLHLPIDVSGFMAQARLRLRPEQYIDRGIYVAGAAHYPCDPERAIFQAYDAAARAARHIRAKEVINRAPAATIDAALCNGCGDCVRVCPFAALTMDRRSQDTRRRGDPGTRASGEDGIGLAVVDPFRCTGCGICVSACPVKAAQVPSAKDEQIEAEVRAALGLGEPVTSPVSDSPFPRVLVFACDWSGYAAAELAGAHFLSYPTSTRIIRIDCTGRLQPGLLLRALELGAAGVMVLGCAPGVCHYEQGNEHAAMVMEQASRLGHLIGFDKRLTLKWIPPDDGELFVRVVEEFARQLPFTS